MAFYKYAISDKLHRAQEWKKKKNLNKGFTKLTVKQDETKALLL